MGKEGLLRIFCRCSGLIALMIFNSFITFSQKVETKGALTDPREVRFKIPINLAFPNIESVLLQDEDYNNIYWEQAILKLPNSYKDKGDPVRLVYLAHGAGGGVGDSSWGWHNFKIVDSLIKNGFACFDVNGGPIFENMGGPWVVQSAFKAYLKIKKEYNIKDKIFVVGGSMGGLSSTNFVYKHSNIVLAHAMFSPVLDLKQAWQHPWHSTTRSSIATSFNFNDKQGNTWEPHKITGWNPIDINTIKANKYIFKIYPVPVKIWHGKDDNVVNSNSSKEFKRYIDNAGGYCELRLYNSGNHRFSGGNRFLDHELLLFLKRFDVEE